ncbi:MAG: hypothetical protein P4M00_06770 [Azospirillaceae bacterium]|nr:hypothetical protein [Azospirillaceae bacterium]
MTELSRQRSIRRDALVAKLRELAGEINNKIREANEFIEKYNMIASQAERLREEIVGEIDLEIEKHADGWLDTKEGQVVDEWRADWEGLDCELAYEIAEPDLSLPDNLEGLPKAPRR